MDTHDSVIGAGAVQTSKRYYEVVIRLQVTDHGNKALAELTMVSKGVHDI